MTFRPADERAPRAGILAAIEDWRHRRWMYRVLRRALTPPPLEAFGAFGRSIIVPPARISLPERIFIGDGVVIHEGVWMSVVRSHAEIEPTVRIGNGVRLGRFNQISCVGEIDIDDHVITSDRVQIGDTSHDYRDPDTPVIRQPMTLPRPVRIGAGALLGAGTIVLPGSTVGEGAYVLDGSIVRGEVPAGQIVSGNPARPVALPKRTAERPSLG